MSSPTFSSDQTNSTPREGGTKPLGKVLGVVIIASVLMLFCISWTCWKSIKEAKKRRRNSNTLARDALSAINRARGLGDGGGGGGGSGDGGGGNQGYRESDAASIETFLPAYDGVNLPEYKERMEENDDGHDHDHDDANRNQGEDGMVRIRVEDDEENDSRNEIRDGEINDERGNGQADIEPRREANNESENLQTSINIAEEVENENGNNNTLRNLSELPPD
ncbi:hypothetical protein G9A89_010027 [Geosiphon pyriformis]|nr:hypothetical protein G9A89_010027 [Geosiphon pyriformis]